MVDLVLLNKIKQSNHTILGLEYFTNLKKPINTNKIMKFTQGQQILLFMQSHKSCFCYKNIVQLKTKRSGFSIQLALFFLFGTLGHPPTSLF